MTQISLTPLHSPHLPKICCCYYATSVLYCSLTGFLQWKVSICIQVYNKSPWHPIGGTSSLHCKDTLLLDSLLIAHVRCQGLICRTYKSHKTQWDPEQHNYFPTLLIRKLHLFWFQYYYGPLFSKVLWTHMNGSQENGKTSGGIAWPRCRCITSSA